MKRKIMMLACVALLYSSAVNARNYVIALSPMQSREVLHQQSAAALKFLLHQVKPGESALVVDGLHLKTIAQFSVKNNKAYNHPKAKAQLNKNAIAAIRRFSEQPVQIAKHGVAAVMQVPQLLQFLGNNYGPFKETTDIIILASPIYVDPRNPDWGMINNQYPGDGHFSAAPQRSPFSLYGRQDLLKNTRIHWAYPDQSWISSEFYRISVTRVWHLLADGYGSELSTFTGDQSTLWRRAAKGAKAAPHGYKLEAVEKIETFQMVEEKQDAQRVSIYERELSDVPPSKHVQRQAQNVEIGISWDCERCDLDLYVRPHHGADVLYFKNRQTDLGYYHKDFRHAPKTDGGYETVTLTSTVDLRDVLIAINWFNGQSENGVTGEIRLAIGDQTYGLNFTFPGKAGNKGIGWDKTITSHRSANGNWLVIDPKDILGV